MPFATTEAWTQVLITLIGAVVTIITTLSGLAIAYMNIKAKVAENTKLTREAVATAAETKTAMVNTQAVARAGAATNRAAVEELKAATEELKRLAASGKKPGNGDAG